jgi:glycosyltransferase involved in cell wall biosynthesis
MKIGYFISHYPYSGDYSDYFCGGTGAVATNLAKKISERDHEVSVFTTSKTKKNEINNTDKINIYRYGASFRIADAYISLKLLTMPLKYKLDMVHAHMGNAPAPIAAWLYSKLKNKPLVVTYHGDQQDNYGDYLRRNSVKLYNKTFAKLILKSADVIISPSEPFIKESKFLPVFIDKVVVIPNGIDKKEVLINITKDECRKELGIPTDHILFLFVGSLSKYKGPDVLLKAAEIVIKKIPKSTFVFVGNGQMASELKLTARKLNLCENIKFAGFVDNNTKYKYFKAADVFTLPSTLNTEVFPIVLLEASASKLPMVVSDLETFNCIIKNEINGIVTRRNDYNNLADSLIKLALNGKLVSEMSKNAYENVSKFSWDKIADETEKIYNRLT